MIHYPITTAPLIPPRGKTTLPDNHITNHHEHPHAENDQIPAMDPPEQLLDAFRAAALSVTKLYKTSATAQSRARQEGYQEAIDDLLSLLDREDLSHSDEIRRVRRWAAERRAGGESMAQDKESEDEVEKEASEPEKPERPEAPQAAEPPSSGFVNVVPSQEQFTFNAPNLATLKISDSQTQHGNGTAAPRPRRVGRQASRTGTSLGRGAGQKRRLNFAEIFDLGSLGNGKDMFGGGKRTRHI